MAVAISGMFGNGTYFSDSPVVIEITGLEWPKDGNVPTSPFNIVRVEVVYNDEVIGKFHADTGGQSSIEFDISSALRTIWSSYDFSNEVTKANNALNGSDPQVSNPRIRSYSLRVYTEYINKDGVFEQTQCKDSQQRTTIPGGSCVTGGLTEWERSIMTGDNKSISYWDSSNKRHGDASTKPTSSLERVGKNSITSWVDFTNAGTQTIFYPSGTTPASDSATAHAPLVLRDGIPYQDFIFRNRRGAVEACSALMMESMDVDVETKNYGRVERPAFRPSRSIMTQLEDGPRRSWSMSSGHVSREWAEWWATEFLTARRVWMLWKGPGMNTAKFVPVTITPAKKSTSIYDRAKQQMPHVDFTATLALEG